VKPFAYERAVDVPSAVKAAAGRDSMFLAGGTNLVDLMKLGVAAPERLIDISRLPLDRFEELPGGGLRVGAMVRNADLAAHRAVRERYPVLAQALLAGASGQIRNLATVGGNLLQRTRCPYFQDVSKPCNKRRPGSGCPARDGEHHNLAIFGHSQDCVATNPSDMAVALAALDARVTTDGPDGARTIPIRELHRLPGQHPERDTVLEPGELITSVELDPPTQGARSAYRMGRYPGPSAPRGRAAHRAPSTNIVRAAHGPLEAGQRLAASVVEPPRK
jgi:xanthine dehydrogenase YagS FAD-binding subunit